MSVTCTLESSDLNSRDYIDVFIVYFMFTEYHIRYIHVANYVTCFNPS